MERQIPKNVRQIGNVSDTPKIYVEDYVDTFFAQLCEKAGDVPIGAFLVGDMQKTDEDEYVYIYGAIRMHELQWSEADASYVIDEDTWKRAYEDCKQYFEEGEMLGWFVAHQGVELKTDNNIVRLHKKSFPKKNTVMIMKDPVEKEEVYFVHKFNDLMEMGGHYTYYEKNPCMQNYMISCRKKNGVSPSETVEDRAAKDFRSLVRSKEERQQQLRANRLMYGLSMCLVLVVLVMGAAMMNNFDRMKSVQSRLDNITKPEEQIAEKDQEAVRETSGNVIAITDGNGQSQDTSEPVEGRNPDEQAADGQATADGQSADGGNAEQSGAAQSGAAQSGAAQDIEIPAGGNGSDGVYVVEQGDTLAIISRKMYGDFLHVDAICRMNGLTDGNLIYIGQKLLLP